MFCYFMDWWVLQNLVYYLRKCLSSKVDCLKLVFLWPKYAQEWKEARGKAKQSNLVFVFQHTHHLSRIINET